jgi:hypothetical protein
MGNITSVELKSKFNFRVYLIPSLMLIFLIFGTVALIEQLKSINVEKIDLREIWLPLFFIIVFVLIFLHEFKNKIINVIIINDTIQKRTFLGFSKTYKFKDFNGFAIRTEKGKIESYEYLYLMKDDKPIITICQTYHKNYYELKDSISCNSKYLGSSNYGLLDEIKDLVKLN